MKLSAHRAGPKGMRSRSSYGSLRDFSDLCCTKWFKDDVKREVQSRPMRLPYNRRPKKALQEERSGRDERGLREG